MLHISRHHLTTTPQYISKVDYFLSKVNSLLRNHKEKYTIDILKESRVYILRYLSGMTIVHSDLRLGLTKDGLPKFLKDILSDVRSREPNRVRFVLTLLSLSRVIKYQGKPDTAQITKPSSTDDDKIINVINKYDMLSQVQIDRFVPEDETELIWTKPHVSTKVGPKGLAMWSALGELHEIDPEMERDLFTLGGERFETYFRNLKDNLSLRDIDTIGTILKTKRLSNKGLRRLSTVHDPEGKCRVIAIFDYWTQSVLKPLHHYCMRSLNRIEEDCTYNQSAIKNFALKSQGPYYSFDLKNATDRFPLTFQAMIMSPILGEDKTNAWKRLMVSKPFFTPWLNDFIKYSVGQPMGAYSSWAVFALCHHIIIRSLFRSIKVSYRNRYRILGDDLVIANVEVANLYKLVMSDLGVEISQKKSYQSADSFEFAKRFFTKTQEVTPFPLQSILSQLSSSTLAGSLAIAYDRGYNIDLTARGYYAALLEIIDSNIKPAFSHRLAKNTQVLTILTAKGKGVAKDPLLIFCIVDALGLPRRCNRGPENHWLLAMEFLAQIKMNELADGIQESFKNTAKYLNSIRGWDWGPHPCPPVVNELPAFKALRNDAVAISGQGTQLTRQVRMGRFDDMFFYHWPELIRDPTKLMTSRKQETTLSLKSKVISRATLLIHNWKVEIEKELKNDWSSQDHDHDW